MPTVRFPVDGTDAEKLTALCALTIQQQGHIALLTHLVSELYANINGHPREVTCAVIDKSLSNHIQTAADDFSQYVVCHQIKQIQDDASEDAL